MRSARLGRTQTFLALRVARRDDDPGHKLWAALAPADPLLLRNPANRLQLSSLAGCMATIGGRPAHECIRSAIISINGIYFSTTSPLRDCKSSVLLSTSWNIAFATGMGAGRGRNRTVSVILFRAANQMAQVATRDGCAQSQRHFGTSSQSPNLCRSVVLKRETALT